MSTLITLVDCDPHAVECAKMLAMALDGATLQVATPMITEAVRAAIAAEREACAAACEEYAHGYLNVAVREIASNCADAIRARGSA